MKPTVELLLKTAIQSHQQGDLDAAKEQYQKILSLDASNGPAHFMLGNLYLGQSAYAEALSHFEQARSLKPTPPEVFMHIGHCHLGQKRWEKAIHALEYALEGPLQEKENAKYLLATAYQHNQQYPEARRLFVDMTNSSFPDQGAIWAGLGFCYFSEERYSEATKALLKALEYDPKAFDAWVNLGNAELRQGKDKDAFQALEKALEIRKDRPTPYYLLGILEYQRNDHEKALSLFEKTLSLDPQYQNVQQWIGKILLCRLEHAQAIKCFQKALEENPSSLQNISVYLFPLNYSPTLQGKEIFQEHFRWGKQLSPKKTSVSFPRRAGKKKIAFLSPDFHHTHPVSLFMYPFFRNYDTKRYEVHCYYSGSAKTLFQNTEEMHWTAVHDLSTAQLKQKIEKDQIDILVDLSGYTANNRMDLFAQRAAPLQINHIGYPASTGLVEMDYRITDHWVDPPSTENEALHTEKLYLLPHGFLCFRPPVEFNEVQVRPQGEPLCFGNFNNIRKMNESVIKLWSQILKACPEAILKMKNTNVGITGAKERIHALFARHGIAHDRVIFLSPNTTYLEHLAQYHQIDIALDPFPYNGTTTTCEALWMGVPVITLAGQEHRSRVGVSLLSQAGYPEWIASTQEDYAHKAIVLAKDAPLRAKTRAEQRAKLKASALCDEQTYVKELQEAYEEMYDSV